MSKAYEHMVAAPKDAVFSAVVRASSELGYAIKHADAAVGVVSFTTGFSMSSWRGQAMTATVVALGETESKLIVTGQRRPTLQLVDWGEKKRLSRALFQRVDEIIHERHGR